MQVQVLLTMEIEVSAGINEMEEQVQEAGQQAMHQALEQTNRHWEDAQRNCPHCGASASTGRDNASGDRHTFGCLSVPRRRFRCQACGHRCYPANRLFAQLEGATITSWLKEAALLAGCSWPYRGAAQLLKKLSGAQISA